MADRDLAIEPVRFRARRDRQDLRDAAFAAVMQVDVEPHTMLGGDAEDRVQMRLQIAVDADGIEAAHEIRPLNDRLVEQCRRAGRAGDTALREGDDLDRGEAAKQLPHPENRLQVPEAELVIDIDVRPHVQGAARHHLLHQIGAGLRFGESAARPHMALGGDAIRHGVARRLVRNPGQAEQGLVEMDVAVDQRRQDEAERLSRRRRQEGRDAAILQFDIVAGAVGKECVAEDHSAASLLGFRLVGTGLKIRVGVLKPQLVPSVTLTCLSHGSSYFPAARSCM
jgi:hypothetical protein